MQLLNLRLGEETKFRSVHWPPGRASTSVLLKEVLENPPVTSSTWGGVWRSIGRSYLSVPAGVGATGVKPAAGDEGRQLLVVGLCL